MLLHFALRALHASPPSLTLPHKGGGNKRWRYGLITALLLALPAHAAPVVADLSTYRIAIDSNFSGIRVFLFGARNDAGEVVVVIRGPARQFIVREKQRVAGMWMNREQFTFHDVPGFYAIAADKPLTEMGADTIMKALAIGPNAVIPNAGADAPLRAPFADALLAYQQARNLYPQPLQLSFMGDTLFKTVIPFPDTIPRGAYTAEIYLLTGGVLTGMQVLPIRVEKSGFDAAVYDFAHMHPLRYGALSILLALTAGWAADRIFRRARRAPKAV